MTATATPWTAYLDLPSPIVLLGLSVVGVLCGVVGCFAMLRRQSLLGDTLAHAALPGVCIAFMLSGSKELWWLLLGASVSGLLGTILVTAITRTTRLKQDAALGIVLSTFFGAGLLLLRYLQDRPNAQQSGLKDFLYGKAAFLQEEQVLLMVGGLAFVLVIVLLLFKELKLFTFDGSYAATLGFMPRWLDLLLGFMVVVAVMLSLRAVGVVLTVGMLIAPAAAARQWTNSLSVMLLLAAVIGVLSGLGGAYWSHNFSYVPTGPAVVLVASVLLVVSLLFAPQRGLLGNWLRRRRHQLRTRRENLLTDFYRLNEKDNSGPSWPVERVAAVRGQPANQVRATLRGLQRRGFVEKIDQGWQLTDAGEAEGRRVVRNHRLWELYLSRRLELPPDHLHRDAEAMEHALGPELVAELEAALDHPAIDPHGVPIPQPRN